MAQLKNAAFSEGGQYFAFYHTDGKLKIWDTTEGVLKQEYTPNEHLTLPCSTLAWVSLPQSSKSPGKKKKRRTEEEGESGGQLMILLGLTSGSVLLYSLATGQVECELQGPGMSAAIRSITWTNGVEGGAYSGSADGTIAHWKLHSKQLSRKWKSGRSPVTALVAHPTQAWLVSASQTVTLWDRESLAELRQFSGHATPITSLLLVPEGNYVVSLASQDRHINVWSLEKSKKDEVAASFVLPDHPGSADISVSEDEGCVRLVVVTEGGALHSFASHINGKRLPPVKPHLTVQIASSEDTASAINSIPILGAKFSTETPTSVHIAHGDPVVMRFEKLNVKTSKEVMWLVRQTTRRIVQDPQPSTSKVKASQTPDKVHYVTAAGVKRPKNVNNAKQLPIEQRINNLSMSTEQPKSKLGPSSDSLAHLLSQGLQSNDQKLLRGILLTKDSDAVASTVARLSPAQVPVLVQELTVLVHWRGWKGEAAARWLHAILVHHGALVQASPDLPQLVVPLLGLVEARLSQIVPLARLRGRLSLLLGQLAHGRTAKELQQSNIPAHEQTPLLHYQDGEESSEDELSLLEDSDSEQRWDEGVEQEESEEEEEDIPHVNGDMSEDEGESSENMDMSS